MLYEVFEFDKSFRIWEEIRIDVLVVYYVIYNYAMKVNDAGKCGFVWRVVGVLLMKILIED